MPSGSDIMQWAHDPIVQTGVAAIVGAAVTHILFRRHPTRRLVGQLVFFAFLTALLLLHGIVPYDVQPAGVSPVQRVFIGLAKIIWWANAAWSIVAIVRVFLIIEGQPREGRLAQDLVVGLVYVAAALSVVAYVFEAPIGTLIATSGVLAIILGLALQSTLSDVFSGLALSLNRPYVIGDRLVLDDGIEGRVVQTNWRSTHLLNGSNDLVVVPNSDLAKARLINLSSPSRSHGMSVMVRLAPTTNPNTMAEVLHSALDSSNVILRTPEPTVMTTGMDASSIEFELGFHVADVTLAGLARNEILDLAYRHLKAGGLSLAFSAGGVASESPSKALPSDRPMTLRLLDAVALFSALSEEEKGVLAAAMKQQFFSRGDPIINEGERSSALLVVRSGVVALSRAGEEVGRLAPGDCLGVAGALMDGDERHTANALTPVVIYAIERAALASVVAHRPRIAEELGIVLTRKFRDSSGSAQSHARSDDLLSVMGILRRVFGAN